jgi:hypothetical protein
MYLTYDLRLDFEKYLNSLEPKPIFAQDALASLDHQQSQESKRL